jgi:hypothetical protein
MPVDQSHMPLGQFLGTLIPRQEVRTVRTEKRKGLFGIPYNVRIEELTVLPDINPQVFIEGAKISQALLAGNDIHEGKSKSSEVLASNIKRK